MNIFFCFVLLWGCSFSSEDISLDSFAHNPTVVIALLEKRESLERLEITMRLVEKYPEKAHLLCHLLEGEALVRCQKISERPHLWTETKFESPSTPRVEKISTQCTQGPLFRSCVEQEIAKYLRKGEVEEVKGLCAHIEEEKWHFECLFGAAEQATLHRGAHGYAEGVDLCLASGDFAVNCNNHLIMLLARKAPSAHSGEKKDWSPVFSAEHAIRAAWSWRDREAMSINQERLWSEAIGMSYVGVKPVTGDPIEVLDAKHSVHVHSALARRLLQIDTPSTHKLSTWVELAEKCLVARAYGAGSRDVEVRFQAAADLWEGDVSQSVVYMATSRRLVSTDPHIDLHIAILEAAARIPPAFQPLLQEGLEHHHPLVQQTAKRLLSKITQQD